MWLRSTWYILTLRCDEADRLRAIARPGELARHQVIAERIHRSLCAGCRRASRELEAIDQGLRDLRGDEARTHPEWNAGRRDRLEASLFDEIASETPPGERG